MQYNIYNPITITINSWTPRNRWINRVEGNPRELGIRNWKREARNKGKLAGIVGDTRKKLQSHVLYKVEDS